MSRFPTLIIAGLTLAASAAFGLPSVTSLMQKMEGMQDQKVDVTAKVNLTQEKVNQGTKVYESLFFRRDKDDSFLMIMTAPDVEKGNGYLKAGDNMWMYRRNTRTFQHVNRDEEISGTDTKAGDFEKRKFTELYKPSLTNGMERISEAMLGKKATYRFEVVAKVNDVTYPKQVFWIEKDTYLPLKVESYSLSGALMSTAYYLKFTMIEGKYFMLKGLFIDEFEKGNKTLMEMSGISLAPIPNSVFTKAYLENLSK
jgi:outer membrane lipoprotein-sorting protein